MTAPIQSLDIPNPAFAGLSKQRQQVPLPAEWATKAENIVIDGAGRLAARKGWVTANTNAISGTPTVVQVHEYVKTTGAVEIISAISNNLYTGTTTPRASRAP